MAVLMEIEFPGGTTEQYDQVNRLLGFPETVPAGMLSHTAADTGTGIRIVDVWESAAAFEAFLGDLGPAGEQVGWPAPAGPPKFTALYNHVQP